MLQEPPVIPHTWAQWFWLIVASVLGYAGSALKEWVSKKRSPAEELKTQAEARQIDAATYLSLIQAANDAITKSCRLQDERDHWEMKSFDLQSELKQVRAENGQLRTQASLDNYQIRKQMAFIETMELKEEYLKLDKPKE